MIAAQQCTANKLDEKKHHNLEVLNKALVYVA